ncbi:hypothetical protein I552_5610 [Mycobacterium xenopi 3993]|nr:hypothetical protein I552_5610 [Mycobacterium xenopi 3993]
MLIAVELHERKKLVIVGSLAFAIGPLGGVQVGEGHRYSGLDLTDRDHQGPGCGGAVEW